MTSPARYCNCSNAFCQGPPVTLSSSKVSPATYRVTLAIALIACLMATLFV